MLTVEVNCEKEGSAVIKISDLAGRLISQKPVQVAVGITTTNLDLQHIAKDPYLLSIETGNGVMRERIVIE